MSDRFVDVVRGYLAAVEGATDWQGDTMSFGGLETTAMPDGAVAPELLLAGHGPRSLALAAAYTNTWNTYGGLAAAPLDGDEFWQLISHQIDEFAKAGTGPSAMTIAEASPYDEWT